MKKNELLLSAFLVLAAAMTAYYLAYPDKTSRTAPNEKLAQKMTPNDFFMMQRSFPDPAFDYRAYIRGMREAVHSIGLRSNFRGFDLEWTTQGPGNIGARVNTLAVHPRNENIIYAGFAHGGVFKTSDGGGSWKPIFDEQPFLSIGDICLDPSDPEKVYVGTGDVNIPGGYFIGDGVYRSTDGGENWESIGLSEMGIISQVLVSPDDSRVIFAAAMGLPSVRDNNRGLYKSTDGGQSWRQVLFVSNQAGVIDLAMRPGNSNVMYAASWDRYRTNYESLVSGTNAAIWKSTDGGENWTKLTNGLPTTEMGRIGLDIFESDPDILFATYVNDQNEFEAIYKSEDAGASWEQISGIQNFMDSGEFSPLGGFGWYFGKMRVNPSDDQDMWLLGVDLWRSKDGGVSWQLATPPWWEYSVHADKHDMVILPSGKVLLATDGGIYQTDLEMETWTDIENIPATQFYRVGYNPHQPDNYYGGAQDNGTSGGNLQFINEWERIYGGDGFQPYFHPTDPAVFYVETQNGNIAVTDNFGGFFQSADQGLGNDRTNWDTPYFISPHNPDVLYAGTYRLHKSTAGIVPDYQPITPDLTTGIDDRYYTISTIHESPVREGLLYAGTSDGRVWRVENEGVEIEEISNSLPERYVTSVKASPDFENYVYVTHSGYKWNEYTPRIHRSKSKGTDWEDISGNLPDIAINDVYILPGHKDSVIFVGTDAGVFGTLNGGLEWERLGVNMPAIPVYDLEWNAANNELIAGTFARSIMTYDLNKISGSVSTKEQQQVVESKNAHVKIYPNPARDFVEVTVFNQEPGKKVELALVNTGGKLLKKEVLNSGGEIKHRLNISGLPPGAYFVKIKNRHTVRTSTFIKS